jgi:hypothetical protein
MSREQPVCNDLGDAKRGQTLRLVPWNPLKLFGERVNAGNAVGNVLPGLCQLSQMPTHATSDVALCWLSSVLLVLVAPTVCVVTGITRHLLTLFAP